MGKYVIYARKSTEEEDRQVLSIDSQISELGNLAGRMGIQISEELTESQSARKVGRAIFNQMVREIKNNHISGVLCWKLDRLARNPHDGASIISAISENGLKIITPTQSYSSDQDNVILMYLEFGMAQKYVDDLSRNVRRGIKAKLEKGGWPGPAPIGYLNNRLTAEIVSDSERFHLVRRMWDLMLTGQYSIEKITDIANNEWGMRTRKTRKRGGGLLGRTTVYKIFSNPFYYGLMERKEGAFWGKHEAMISEKEFDMVQAILGRNGRPKPKRHIFAFTGLIRCGHCGCFITAEEKHKVTRSGVHFYTYYHCTRRKREYKCREPSADVNALESQIASFLEKLKISEGLLQWGLQYLKEMAEEQERTGSNIVHSVEKAYRDVQKQLDTLTKMRLRELISDEEFLKQKAELSKQERNLKERLDNPEKAKRDWLEPTEKVLIMAFYAKNWFLRGNLQQKRQILESVGSNLILKERVLLLSAKKPFVYLENRGDFSNWWSVVNDIRTFFMNSHESIAIPTYDYGQEP